jgi:5-dehydro-4-deoxyglucarate dehydratase
MSRVGKRLHWVGGVGDDCVPAYYSIGIRTYTSSIATVAPKLSLMLHEAASAPGSPTLGRLMGDSVVPLYALRARRKGYEVSVMKEMMNQLGMAAGPVRPPLPQLTPADKEEVQLLLKGWSPILD